jgi:site-specific recombinase XerC
MRPALPALTEIDLEPLFPYVNDQAINGATGIFKNKNPNLLKADTDIDAIVVTLRKYADKRPTLKVYAREISRFCLWAYKELHLPISSIGVHEARLYREFLDNIPGDWISTSPSPPPRNTTEWRPFRGQLDEASKRKALTSVNVILNQLMNGGYLIGNPMSGVLKHAELANPKIDVARSFSIEQWTFACGVLDAEIENSVEYDQGEQAFGGDKRPILRRLKALLHLLFATGVRRDELFKARLGHLKRILVDGQASHLLTVTGKRSKPREVLIEQDVMQLVLDHVADRSRDFADDLDTQQGRNRIPLISVLRRPVKTYRRESKDDQDTRSVERGIVMGQRDMASREGALSADGMLAQIKSFFARCATLAQDAGIDREAFDNATLHWMRHTFGHSMVDAQVDIRVVQKALGHVNINTTAIYSKADMEQMVRGLRQGSAVVRRTGGALPSPADAATTPISLPTGT